MPSTRPEASGARGVIDVIVVGGGPAGAATALALRRRDAGVRVAIVERTDYSAFRVGETLPPPARRLLAELGVWDAFSSCGAVASFGTRASWGRAEVQENAFIFSPYGRGWHVDRRAFDAWLVSEAERAGADVWRRTRAQIPERRGTEWTLQVIDTAGAQHEIRGRVLVDATGRQSRMARALGARPITFDRLAGAAVRLRVEKDATRADSYTEVEACRHGWWYTAMLPEGHLLAIFMTDAEHLRRTPWRTVDAWRALAADAPLTAARIANGVAIDRPFVCPASSQRLDVCAGDGWLAAGDAACTVDPLSSQGVMRALRSGIVTARAVLAHASGDAHALAAHHARIVKEYDAYLDTRHAYYAAEQRWPESPFWQGRHTSLTGGGTTYAVRLENQHHEEPEEGTAGDLLVRGDTAGADRRPDLLGQPG